MSNLIEKQAAIKVASKECFELRGVFGLIEEGLNELPTVKAIPIEWLQKKYDKWKDRDMLGWSYCIKLLIEDWGKENERMDNR